MKRINSTEALQEIAQRRDFNAGNFWGRWDSNGEKYVVYSYRQWIAIYDATTNAWAENPNKYSRTTSKHQNYTRRAISLWQAVSGVVSINA